MSLRMSVIYDALVSEVTHERTAGPSEAFVLFGRKDQDV